MTHTLPDSAAPLARRPAGPARPTRPVRPPPASRRPPRPAPPAHARRSRRGQRRLTERPGFVVGLALVTVLFAVWELTGSDDAPEPSAAGAVVQAEDEPDGPAEPAQHDAVAAASPAVTSTGEFVRVPGTGERAGSGRLVTYRVEVETGVPLRPEDFAAEVDAALLDPRGWTVADGVSLQRTDADAATLTVVLASPATTDRLCRPLRTMGRYSCYASDRAVINADRWLRGAPSYADDLPSYRTYVVNHEVGHGLGHGHRSCPTAGAPAPVMVQQTKGLSGCARNPWPTTG